MRSCGGVNDVATIELSSQWPFSSQPDEIDKFKSRSLILPQHHILYCPDQPQSIMFFLDWWYNILASLVRATTTLENFVDMDEGSMWCRVVLREHWCGPKRTSGRMSVRCVKGEGVYWTATQPAGCSVIDLIMRQRQNAISLRRRFASSSLRLFRFARLFWWGGGVGTASQHPE